MDIVKPVVTCQGIFLYMRISTLYEKYIVYYGNPLSLMGNSTFLIGNSGGIPLSWMGNLPVYDKIGGIPFHMRNHHIWESLLGGLSISIHFEQLFVEWCFTAIYQIKLTLFFKYIIICLVFNLVFNYCWTSLQRPPWGLTGHCIEVVIVGMFQ